MATTQDVFLQALQVLNPAERLRLASLLLEDALQHMGVHYSEEWTEEDLADLTACSLKDAFKDERDASVDGSR